MVQTVGKEAHDWDQGSSPRQAGVASRLAPVACVDGPEGFMGGILSGESTSGQDVCESRSGDCEDEKAIKAFRSGDRASFDRLVLRHRGQVYRICYRFTGNHHDADDLSQDVFLRAYKGLPTYKGQSRFSTWLYRVAVNTCLNWVSARKSKTEPLPENLPDRAPGQVEGVTRAEVSRAVREALAHLPEKQRITLVLRTFHGLSHREISELLGNSIGATKANFFFALRNMRKVLEKTGLSKAEW